MVGTERRRGLVARLLQRAPRRSPTPSRALWASSSRGRARRPLPARSTMRRSGLVAAISRSGARACSPVDVPHRTHRTGTPDRGPLSAPRRPLTADPAARRRVPRPVRRCRHRSSWSVSPISLRLRHASPLGPSRMRCSDRRRARRERRPARGAPTLVPFEGRFRGARAHSRSRSSFSARADDHGLRILMTPLVVCRSATLSVSPLRRLAACLLLGAVAARLPAPPGRSRSHPTWTGPRPAHSLAQA